MKNDFNFFSPYLDKWHRPFAVIISFTIVALAIGLVIFSNIYFGAQKDELIKRSDIASEFLTRPDIVKLKKEYQKNFVSLGNLNKMAENIDINLSELDRISYIKPDLLILIAEVMPSDVTIQTTEISDGVISIAGSAAKEDSIPEFLVRLGELEFISKTYLSTLVENSEDNNFSFTISANVRDVK